LTENFRTSGQCNKGFQMALNKHMISNKYVILVMTNVTLVRIVLKLKLSFIKLSKLIYLMWNPRMTLTLPR
jgi:hypothetical protein